MKEHQQPTQSDFGWFIHYFDRDDQEHLAGPFPKEVADLIVEDTGGTLLPTVHPDEEVDRDIIFNDEGD